MKKFIAIISICMLFAVLSGCNKDIFDTTYTFDRAIIKLANGEVIEGKVTSWTDYDDGDQIQVEIEGKTYLVHSTNIAMIAE